MAEFDASSMAEKILSDGTEAQHEKPDDFHAEQKIFDEIHPLGGTELLQLSQALGNDASITVKKGSVQIDIKCPDWKASPFHEVLIDVTDGFGVKEADNGWGKHWPVLFKLNKK